LLIGASVHERIQSVNICPNNNWCPYSDPPEYRQLTERNDYFLEIVNEYASVEGGIVYAYEIARYYDVPLLVLRKPMLLLWQSK